MRFLSPGFARCEEPRPHVHVQHAEGEAKFWIEPAVELHANYGLKAKRLAEAHKCHSGSVLPQAWRGALPRGSVVR